MLSFVDLLKHNNIRISNTEILDLYNALTFIPYNKDIFKQTVQTCLVKQQEDLATFNDLFEGYFYIHKQKQTNFEQNFENLLNMFNPDFKPQIDININDIADNIVYNSNLETNIKQYLESINQPYDDELVMKIKYKVINNNLNNIIEKHIDIETVPFEEYKNLDDIQLKLALQMLAYKLLKVYVRKQRNSRKGIIDIKKTLMNVLNPKIVYKKQKLEKHNLIIVADISGSMTDYIYYILQMVVNIVNVFNDVKIFVFMEKVKELKDFDTLQCDILNLYNKSKLGYGTDYNNVFYMLNNKNLYNKNTYMMIIGDGLNGKQENGIQYLCNIRKQVKQIYWLNPNMQDNADIKQYKLYSKMYECKNLKQLILILNEVTLNGF